MIGHTLISYIAVAALATFTLACEPPPTAPADEVQPEVTPAALAVAHDAYLDNDFRAMSVAIKHTFLDPAASALSKRNALDLLQKAYEVGRGRVPADWHLPRALKRVKVNQIRKEEPEKLTFELQIAGNCAKEDVPVQIRLVQAPDKVLLDRKAGIGVWTVETDDEGVYFEIEGNESARPAPDGLYFLDIEMPDGEVSHGWFMMSDMVSSDTPRVHSPKPGAILNTSNPTVTWDDFQSPQYKPYERRSLGVWVVAIDMSQTPPWSVAWSLWSGKADITTTTVGADPKGDRQVQLPDGNYWVGVNYGERRRFGDIVLVRKSRTSRPFSVRAGGR